MGVVRRGFAGALSGLGEGISSTGNAYLQHIFHGEDMDKENALITARENNAQAERMGQFMLQHPEAADAIQKFGAGRGQDLSAFRPSDETLLDPMRHAIGSAKDELSTPSVEDLIRAVQNTGRVSLNTPITSPTLAAGAPSPAPPESIAAPGDNGADVQQDQSPKSIQDLLAARQAHLEGLQKQRETTYQDLQQRSKAEALGQGLGKESADNQAFPAVLVRDMVKTKALGPINATNAGLTTGAQFDATHTPDRIRGAARLTGAETGARAAAELPYQTPTFGTNSETGDDMATRPDGKGGMVPVQLPKDFTKQTPQKLQASQVDTISGLNTAEVEGVKVLRELKATGLDKSNDPADPRWERFVVSKLQVAPGSYQKADIQQRVAFIHAAILKSLMGGRPNQYIAKMYAEHTPQGDQAGMQLTHVLNNVLEQTGGRRQEIEAATGRKLGSLSPVSGETYADYLKSIGGSSMLDGSDPNPLDPSLADILNRKKGG